MFSAMHGMRNACPRGRGRTDARHIFSAMHGMRNACPWDAGAPMRGTFFPQGMGCEMPAREDAGAPTRGRHFSRLTFAAGDRTKMNSLIIWRALAVLFLS